MPNYDWLNSMLEFDHVIRVNPDLTIDDHPTPHIYAPESVIGTDDNGQISDADEKVWLNYLASQGWEALDGWSSQYGYSGPIMHPSEYIGGYLAEYILDHPGLYVVTSVETMDDSEEAAGWVVLFREIELPVELYRCPCCGDDVMSTRPICSDCELAQCERSNDVTGERSWWNCQRPDIDHE